MTKWEDDTPRRRKASGGLYEQAFTCVNCPPSLVNALMECVDTCQEITAKTFRYHIGADAYAELEAALGYDRYLRLAKDFTVTFCKGLFNGHRVYFLQWSAIEYVYAIGGASTLMKKKSG